MHLIVDTSCACEGINVYAEARARFGCCTTTREIVCNPRATAGILDTHRCIGGDHWQIDIVEVDFVATRFYPDRKGELRIGR